MDVDFAIPLNKDGLMSGEAGYYVVDEVFPARSLPSKVAGESILRIKTNHFSILCEKINK